MGKSSGGKVQVTEYSLSMHIGLGVPVDAVLEIQIGEKTAWAGNFLNEGSIFINNSELFGGIKKEGGVKGQAYFLPGRPDQVMPDSLAARFGLTSLTCPGFRGISSLFFVGSAVAGPGWTPVPGGGGGSGGGGSGDDGPWIPPGGDYGDIPVEVVPADEIP